MRIDLPDDVATALQSQAAAQGITLQALFEKLATNRPARPRYTLDELMKQCDPQLPMTDEDRAWLDDSPAGREAL